MAQIPRKYIDNFTKALNKISADAQKRLADDLAKVNFDGNVATIRDVFIDRMELYCGPYSDMAAVLAAEFYDGLRKFQIGSALGALAESGREPIATEKAVRAIVQDIVDGKPKETVIGKLVSRVDFEIKRSAGECVYRNGKRDPLKPRFARVPSGSETCSFCIMLASRGFVYRTKETAGEGNHYHANCDCRIVPGFDGETTVAGYDPDTLYDQWKHPEKYPELREARNARRRELYAEKHAGVAKESARWTSEERRKRKRDIDMAIKCEKPVFISPKGNEQLVSNIRKIKPDPDYYDVHAHGSVYSVECFSSDISAKTMAHIIKSREDYDGRPIRLFSCHAGEADADGNCFARELADIMGVEIKAAPSFTIVKPDGSFYFGSPDVTDFVTFEAKENNDLRD